MKKLHHLIAHKVVHLVNLIYNLLDNAIKYSKENPIIKIKVVIILLLILVSIFPNCEKHTFPEDEFIIEEIYPLPVNMIGQWTEYLIYNEHGDSLVIKIREWEFYSDLTCTKKTWDRNTNTFGETDRLFWQYNPPREVVGSSSGINFIDINNNELCKFNSNWLDSLPTTYSDSLTCVYMDYGCDILHLDKYDYLWVRKY